MTGIKIIVPIVVTILGLFILIGYVFLSYDWWDDAGPNNGRKP